MKQSQGFMASVLVAMALVLAPGIAASADDEVALFDGLIVGQSMDETEMDNYYGKGMEQFVLECTGGTCVFAPEGNSTSQNVNMSGSQTGNQGIAVSNQVAGDYNTVNTTIMINVNIGTVSVESSPGSTVIVNQSTDLTGSQVNGFSD